MKVENKEKVKACFVLFFSFEFLMSNIIHHQEQSSTILK